MTVSEKVAYLKGLTDGLGIDANDKMGKIVKAVIDVLDDVALSVEDLEDGYAELCDQIDSIDEDLSTIEEEYYGSLDDEDLDDDDFEDDFDDDLYEVKCPSCGDTVCIDDAMLDEGQIDCPNCGELLEFDLDECECDCDDEGCSCGCDHDHH